MGNLIATIAKYPRFLIGFVLGVFNSVATPLVARSRSNPVTAVALIAALISGGICLLQILEAMVMASPQNGDAMVTTVFSTPGHPG